MNHTIRSNHERRTHSDIMPTIAGITGKQFLQGTHDYPDEKYQYASSSHEVDHNMNPGLIIQPQNIDDIALTLKYAKSQNIAVAVRTGGHQYSGASSTSPANIQLDLKTTFQGPDDRAIFEKDGKTFVRTSVSWSLGSFNAYLKENKVFIPHGQCTGASSPVSQHSFVDHEYLQYLGLPRRTCPDWWIRSTHT